MDRRTFFLTAAALCAPVAGRALGAAAVQPARRRPPAPHRVVLDIGGIEHDRVMALAEKALTAEPITITASRSDRSAGGPHDFFSEGDYWWPDPQNPDGPYIQKDGMSNPDNFVAHRQALMRLSQIVPTLAAGWMLTQDPRYARQAADHLRAWFLDDSTLMNPNLQYAQAIKGRATGR